MKQKIIATVGPPLSGKSTFCGNVFGYAKVSFADPLYAMLAALLGDDVVNAAREMNAKDTPPGLWVLDHYEALPAYDGDIPDQLAAGALTAFGCHYDTGDLCRGWIDCHGEHNLLALRLAPLRNDPGPPTVPVYESGQACLDANRPHCAKPSKEAKAAMKKLLKRKATKK